MGWSVDPGTLENVALSSSCRTRALGFTLPFAYVNEGLNLPCPLQLVLIDAWSSRSSTGSPPGCSLSLWPVINHARGTHLLLS